MAKHDRAQQEKVARNAAYALIYRQKVCKNCGHRSCKPGRCIICGSTQRKPRR